MNEKERKDYKLQTRVTKTVYDQVNELDVDLREIVDYYITHNTNPTLKLKNRQKELLNSIAEWEENISKAKEELKEVNQKLGVPIDETSATLEVSTIGERIKDNCQSENNGKCDKSRLSNFITSGRGKTILKHGLSEYNIKDQEKREKFIRDVFKYLSISDVDFGKNFEI